MGTFIHIGYPRTGTTFLQKHVMPQCRNAEYHKVRGLDYWPVDGLKNVMINENLVYMSPDSIFKRFPKAKIIVTTRDQTTMIPSHYQYVYIKAGGTLSYRQYARQCMQLGMFDYSKDLRRWRELFTVHELRYETLQRDQGAFLKMLFDIIGVEEKIVGTKNRNRRYNPFVTRAKRLQNMRLLPKGRLADRLINKLSTIIPAPGFEDVMKEEIEDYYRS